MYDILAALALTAAATIPGLIFLSVFRTKNWRTGNPRYTDSGTLAGLTLLVFTALPGAAWVASDPAARGWGLLEVVTATVVTFVAMRRSLASAARARAARIHSRKK